jgi:N-acetylmuramoyl-L-alanine amidase
MRATVAARRASLAWRGTLVPLCLALLSAVPAVGDQSRAITRVDVRPESDRTVVALYTAARDPLEVQSFTLEDPPRLVFDVPGARLAPELPASFETVAPALAGIRLGQFSADPDIARIVVDLCETLPPPEWETARGGEGETLIVLRSRGPAVLGRPALSVVEGAVLVRLPGAGMLARSVATLNDPPRLYADLTDAVIEEHCRVRYEKGAVCEVRMGQQPADPHHPVARIVVEMREPQTYTVFSDGADLVLGVGPQAWGLPLPKYPAEDRLRGKTIVVDPGHGGDDTGAPAYFGPPPRGPYEKDIVLDIGRRLARLLRAEGASVTMTRSDDRYLTLQQRAEVANRLSADAIISLHCNSCDGPNSLCGTSVYYDHAHSRGFARLVQAELITALGTEDNGVRNANFAVIRQARVPGILVEAAYINHEGDRQRLVHPNFRERTARAIVRGLIKFLNGTPGRGPAG